MANMRSGVRVANKSATDRETDPKEARLDSMAQRDGKEHADWSSNLRRRKKSTQARWISGDNEDAHGGRNRDALVVWLPWFGSEMCFGDRRRCLVDGDSMCP